MFVETDWKACERQAACYSSNIKYLSSESVQEVFKGRTLWELENFQQQKKCPSM